MQRIRDKMIVEYQTLIFHNNRQGGTEMKASPGHTAKRAFSDERRYGRAPVPTNLRLTEKEESEFKQKREAVHAFMTESPNRDHGE